MNKLMSLSLSLLLACAFTLVSCQGEDGEPGPVGPKGPSGEDGIGLDGVDAADGSDGLDGKDAPGYAELTNKGGIVITLKGTAIDGVTIFDQTFDLKFAPTSAKYNYYDPQGIEPEDAFYFHRLGAPPGDFYSGDEAPNFIVVELFRDKTSGLLNFAAFDINLDIEHQNNKFTNISQGFMSFLEQDGVITNFSYDAETGLLQFDFDFIADAAFSVTDHELHVSGKVSVTLYYIVN